MASREDIALMSHLMRRAGFGAARDEIESLCDQGYEATVEELLDPDSKPPVDEYALYRHHPTVEQSCQPNWLYFMTTTQRPLQEKVALFWHHIFATSFVKLEARGHLLQQIALFREHGMGSYRDLLISMAKDPAMIFWLDNHENHKRAPNENWGRELLELFSLGVGNYTEKDVSECSRAFTGWTIDAKMPKFPYGPWHPWKFVFRAEDHDYTEKTFLGQTGNFDGEDIIDIILQQPACPRFISRHLHNFFVADEPQVPAWNVQEPRDPEAVQLLSETLVENDFEIKPVLRTLFNSDFFKEATYQKVKSPVEVVVSTLRSTGDLTGPDPRLLALAIYPGYMGQNIMDPPSVEGWHTGVEWINSGSLVNRVNFVADRVSNTDLPGVRRMVERVATNPPKAGTMTATELVDRCLDILGPLTVSDITRDQLLAHVESGGAINPGADVERRTTETFALIVATREYQFG